MTDAHGNKIAKQGCDRCFCGCKYWEHDRCIDCGEKVETVRWQARKEEGERVADMLGELEVGTTFRLANVNRAYAATYRKNADGTWSQISAPELPLVLHMDAAHLGFCVGEVAIGGAIR